MARMRHVEGKRVHVKSYKRHSGRGKISKHRRKHA